jgi:hypothetical protein
MTNRPRLPAAEEAHSKPLHPASRLLKEVSAIKRRFRANPPKKGVDRRSAKIEKIGYVC